MSNNENNYGFGGQLSAGVNYDTTAPGPVQATPTNQPSTSGMLNLSKNTAEPVMEISTAQFSTEVIQASREKPVLIDFWAPWCGPCKQLAPALEAAVAKTAGRVKLVKMNIDDHPEIAGQMGIQSIPAVVAFVNGQPMDAFMGAKSEREITQFLDKLIGPSGPSELELVLEEASELMANEAYGQARQLYNAILAQIPDNLDAIAGSGMAALKEGRLEEAKLALASAGEDVPHPALAALKVAIEVQEQASGIGDLSELEEIISKHPNNHDSRFDLALALNAKGRREEAADHLLDIIARDRKWRDDGAKAQLLLFFEAWGPKDAVTNSARRRLSSLLFA